MKERRVSIAGKEVNLTAKEFDVLELLVFNPNKVYSRENLLNIVWGYEYPGDVRTVDCKLSASKRRSEAESQRHEIRSYQMGRRLLFPADLTDKGKKKAA